MMMGLQKIAMLAALGIVLSACATLPTGPSVMVLPGRSKSFDQFQADDGMCRGWAGQQSGLNPGQLADQRTVQGAITGSAVGAAAGALIGAASYEAGPGALIGAGAGLLLGTGVGDARGQWMGAEQQRRYDISYTQCMYAKGNSVPVPHGFAAQQQDVQMSSSPPPPRRAVGYRPPARRSSPPPPPPGSPPPPPPDAG